MAESRLVLGTAGHIDHGKTAVVRALTGVDTDRLKEEKARGITIELGFAHLEAGGLTVSLVDVPGHERFIRAMSAGAAGVDAVMLVVAADEGVMPQTREHLAICSLLGVRAGLVVMNKIDLVDDPEWLELVQSDLRDAVQGTFLEDAAIVPCSAHTGEGIERVREAIETLAGEVPTRQSDGLLRLPMDRVFTMTGHGTVVTGTLIGGAVTLGDDLVAAPTRRGGTVRGLQVHGAEVSQAVAGQRTAVNLRGVDREELERGQVLVRRGEITPTRRIDARIQLLGWNERPLKRGKALIVLQGTTHAQGRVLPLSGPAVEPGEAAWAQIELDRPLVVLPGDRFVLQGFTLTRDHGSTVGGGQVVRSHPSRRKRLDPGYAAFLSELAGAPPAERVAMEVAAAGLTGLPLARLLGQVPYAPPETHRQVGSLLAAGRLEGDEDALMEIGPFERLQERIVGVVSSLGDASPMADGFGRQEIYSRLGFPLAPRLYRLAVDRLIGTGRLEGNPEQVAPPGSADRQARRELAERVRETIEAAGYEPPKPAALAASLGVSEPDVRDVLASLIKQGSLVRAKDDMVFGARTIEGLRGKLVSFLEEHGEISPTEFKEMCGVTRKYLIPLSELFDEQKVTLRVGNVRRLRR